MKKTWVLFFMGMFISWMGPSVLFAQDAAPNPASGAAKKFGNLDFAEFNYFNANPAKVENHPFYQLKAFNVTEARGKFGEMFGGVAQLPIIESFSRNLAPNDMVFGKADFSKALLGGLFETLGDIFPRLEFKAFSKTGSPDVSVIDLAMGFAQSLNESDKDDVSARLLNTSSAGGGGVTKEVADAFASSVDSFKKLEQAAMKGAIAAPAPAAPATPAAAKP
ncbi:MAG: hypothetical protein U1F57_09090 [bacterium]